jgi:hypothetical protein
MCDEVDISGDQNNQTPEVGNNTDAKITPDFAGDEDNMKRFSLFDNSKQMFLRMRTHSVLIPSSS